MRILFSALHFGYFRNQESAIARLAERGHEIVLTADIEDTLGGRMLVERLAGRYPNVTFRFTEPLTAWPWMPLAAGVRRSLELLRFSDPAYDAQPKYRNRADVRSPRIVRRWARVTTARRALRPATMKALAAVERGIPPPPSLCALVRETAPDIVLLASVTHDGAPQMDHLKAARARGVPVAMAVHSWDHLSGKALIHIAPDRLMVWNDTQRDEAVRLHGIDASRIVVTGVQAYDQWFGRTPSRSRAAFCQEFGFDPAQPIVLYVCSVLSRPAPPEPPFVFEWIAALRRAADPRLRGANVLIRPHPERLYEWDDVDLSGMDRVALRGRNPIDPTTKADYFDSLYHASAVVGVFTSAFLEAAVVGRSSLTIEEPRFQEHQEGAPHYQYIRDPSQGLVLVAPDLETHVAQLARVLAHDPEAEARTRQFVASFIRPWGLDVPATDRFVESVESMASVRSGGPVGTRSAAAAAWLARALVSLPGLRALWWTDEEAQRQARPAEERREKAMILRERQQRRDAKAADREHRLREKDRRRRAKRRKAVWVHLRQQAAPAWRALRRTVINRRRGLGRVYARVGARFRGESPQA